MSFSKELAQLRAAHPDIRSAEVFFVDLNGQSRGKLVPIDALEKLDSKHGGDGMKMPVSGFALDIFSQDTEGADIALDRGDPDGHLTPVPGTLAPIPWAARPMAQVQVQITNEDGKSPCEFNPRRVLEHVAETARKRGVTPVMALELEFWLVDPIDSLPACEPTTGTRLSGGQFYSMDIAQGFAHILDEIGEASRALGAPAGAVGAECGPGQFEMNLGHVACPIAAADHMIALKRSIRGVARKHGLDAGFMPKPYGDQPGSGLHLHMSLLDRNGKNLFAAGKGGTKGAKDGVSKTARNAVGGMIETMGDFMLIFAPNPNSYRRLAPGTFAPTVAAWGLDNRGTALRIPATEGKAARIEHRTAGADANPYLAVAAILAGALEGIKTKAEPPSPVISEPGPDDGLLLPLSWWSAERQFESSKAVARLLGAEFQRVFAAQKRQERKTYMARIPDTEYEIYFRRP